MRVLDALGLAARSLRAHRFRALLTVLSVSIGAFGIVFMSSLAQSGFETLKRGIEEVGGARLLLVVPKTPERAQAKASAYRLGMSPRDRESILREIPHVTAHSAYATLGLHAVTADDGGDARASLVAGDRDFLSMMRLSLRGGRAFEQHEHDEHARVCVIGSDVADTLWRGDGVGRDMTIGGMRCRITGVLALNDRFAFNIGFDWNKLVLIPAEAGADWFPEMPLNTFLVFRTDTVSSNDIVKRILNARLVQRHHGIDDFSLLDFANVLTNFYAVFVIMECIAACLAGVALLIGGVGIMNMMLVSVSERVREIGIQKALGAGPVALRVQFSSEAVLLSAAGGLGGAALGVVVASVASKVLGSFVASWAGTISWVAVFGALLSALCIGIGFGWLPARRAARLQPAEAIRR